MAKILKTKFRADELKKYLSNLFYFGAKRAFVLFWVFLFVGLFFCGLLVYHYGYAPEHQQTSTVKRQSFLNNEAYQKFIAVYQARQKEFNQLKLKVYWDAFAR